MSTIPVYAASMTSALVAAIWQGLLLTAVVALCLRFLPALTAAARSLIWLTVGALAVLLHFTQSPAPADPVRSTLQPAMQLDSRWGLLIAAVWAVASLTRTIQLGLGAIELHRLARTAIPIAAPHACAALLFRSRRAESRPAQLCTSTQVDRPSVLGFFRPRVLLPAGLLETLTAAELQQVLLHELEHLRRRDDWTNLLGRLALVAFPLNPVLLWLEYRLATERERACDDRVLEATGARKAYATCLAHLASHTLVHRGVSLALGLFGINLKPGQSELARRVTRILSLPTPTLHPRTSAALITLLIALSTGGSIELAHSPQLIHFTNPEAQLTATNLTPDSGQFIPAAFHPHTSPSPFVMTKAVLSTTSPSIPHTPATLTSASSARPAPRHPFHSAAHRIVKQQTSFIRLTSFDPEAASAPLHLTLTVATVNQFSYAAVPVQGGWILVLLPTPAAQPSLTLNL